MLTIPILVYRLHVRVMIPSVIPMLTLFQCAVPFRVPYFQAPEHCSLILCCLLPALIPPVKDGNLEFTAICLPIPVSTSELVNMWVCRHVGSFYYLCIPPSINISSSYPQSSPISSLSPVGTIPWLYSLCLS